MSHILKFKTNINCQTCIKSVSAHLNNAKDIIKWEVNTNTSDKLLLVESNNLSADQIISIIDKAGFKAQAIH